MKTRGRSFLLAGGRPRNAGAFPNYFLSPSCDVALTKFHPSRTGSLPPRRFRSALRELAHDRAIPPADFRAGWSDMTDLLFQTPEQEKHHA